LKNGWTGGQYSLFRILFGAYLCLHFLALAPWGEELFSNRGALPDASASPLVGLFPNLFAFADSPAVVLLAILLAAAASLAFAAGWKDRAAALGIWWVWACLFGRNPLISNPSLPFVGWILLAHLFLPRAPFGSVAARGRPDPGGGWRMPPGVFAAAWIVLSVAYTYSGATKLASPSWRAGTALVKTLDNPLARPGPLRDLLLSLPEELLQAATWIVLGLEILFAPLALFRAIRPWLWLALLGMHASLVAVLDFADLSLGMGMIHLFTFDPAWIRPRRSAAPATLFYDGACGLCHRFVRFVLAEDRQGLFRFAPLGGATFSDAIPADRRAGLPDSLVVRTAEGGVFVRSAATLHVLGCLGGAWRLLGGVARLVPGPIRDRLYDGIARARSRLFRRPPAACPVGTPETRARFSE